MEPDPEQIAQHERTKRENAEEWYHAKLADYEKKLEEHDDRFATVETEVKESRRRLEVQKKLVESQQDTIKDMDKKLKDAEQRFIFANESAKFDQKLVSEKEYELKNMQKKKAEFFQEKKKAQEELAESRATNKGLHERCDQLEKENAEAHQQIAADAAVKEDLSLIHRTIEETFADVKCDDLSTPELAMKLREHENRLTRVDSQRSVHSQAKKSGMSLKDDLAGLESDEGSEAEDEGDRTLTEGFEIGEMKQKVEKLEDALEGSKTQEGVYLDKISKLGKELAEAKKRAAETEKPKEQLGFSSVTAVDTKPISPTPATPTQPQQPPQQELGYSDITSVGISPISPTFPALPPPQYVAVSRKPTARDCWEQMPGWLSALLLLCALLLAYFWMTTVQERALWLGANDVVRSSAVRLAVRRKEAYCGTQGQFEGVLAPLWLAVQRWLGLPMPTMLT